MREEGSLVCGLNEGIAFTSQVGGQTAIGASVRCHLVNLGSCCEHSGLRGGMGIKFSSLHVIETTFILCEDSPQVDSEMCHITQFISGNAVCCRKSQGPKEGMDT